MNPYKLREVYKQLTSQNSILKKYLKLGTKDIKQPDLPAFVEQKNAINRFVRDNPRPDQIDRKDMAAGGMLAQPSTDGVRQGYATSTVKTKKFKYPITNQFGTFYSDKAPPKVKSKYDNLTPEMKDFYKKTTGKTWNKKDWDSGNYQRQNLSRKGKQSKVVKESTMSPFYKKIGFFKQFENNMRVKGERLKLNKKGYITFQQLNKLLERKDTESAIDDLKRVIVGDRPSPWLEKKEGVAKWKKSKNLVIQRGDSMGTNYIKYPDKKTLKSMKEYYKNQEFIDIAKRDVLRKPSIEGMKVFYEDKDLMNAIRKWSGNPNDKEALKIINSVFGAEELAGPNAIKNLGRALIGEIKVKGIKQDKVLGKKILEGVTRTANGQAGRSAWDQAAYMYAKDRMNMLFERGIGDKSFQQFFDEIDGLLRETLGKNRAKFHIDEVFSLRTGLTNNNQVYSVFSQILDKNLNSKIKQNYDATFSKNLINVRKELAKTNPDFNEVKRITDLQNVKYKEYSSKYPNAKFSTFGEFDIEKNRFKSPEEVFGKERFNELPSDIQKKIKQDYRKNRISIDVGGAQTQKELLTSLEKNIEPGSTLNKKQFNNLLAKIGCPNKVFKKASGGRVGYQDGTDICPTKGAQMINSGMKNASPAQLKNFAVFANRARALGRGVMKFGIIPEAMYVAADATIRLTMGDKPVEALLRASEYLLPGDQTKLAEVMEATRLTNPETAAIIGRSIDYKNQLAKIQSLEDTRANLENLSGGGEFDYIGNLNQDVRNLDNQIKQATDNLNANFKMTDAELIYANRMQDEVDDIRKSKSFLTKIKSMFRDTGQDASDVETLGVPEVTQEQLNKRMADLLPRDLLLASEAEMLQAAKVAQAQGFKIPDDYYIQQQQDIKNMSLAELAAATSPEQVYGASGTMGEPLNKGVVEKPQNIISDMEREITGQTNVANPFDLDLSMIGDGLRGFSAAGGGIAKEAGVDSGVPPESGPNPQGLSYLMKRGKNI